MSHERVLVDVCKMRFTMGQLKIPSAQRIFREATKSPISIYNSLSQSEKSVYADQAHARLLQAAKTMKAIAKAETAILLPDQLCSKPFNFRLGKSISNDGLEIRSQPHGPTEAAKHMKFKRTTAENV